MNIDDEINNRIREIVREEIALLTGQIKRLTPKELADRWRTNEDVILRLARSGQLRPIKLSERKMVFSIEEILRFEEVGGVAQLSVAA